MSVFTTSAQQMMSRQTSVIILMFLQLQHASNARQGLNAAI